jgi:hypothetical protein
LNWTARTWHSETRRATLDITQRHEAWQNQLTIRDKFLAEPIIEINSFAIPSVTKPASANSLRIRR